MKKDWVLSYPLSAQQRLIRLGRCPGWSESLLGAHATLLVLSRGGSNNEIPVMFAVIVCAANSCTSSHENTCTQYVYISLEFAYISWILLSFSFRTGISSSVANDPNANFRNALLLLISNLVVFLAVRLFQPPFNCYRILSTASNNIT